MDDPQGLVDLGQLVKKDPGDFQPSGWSETDPGSDTRSSPELRPNRTVIITVAWHDFPAGLV